MIRFALAAIGVAALCATGAAAQSWPSQTVKLVVPFTPGTGMDTIARTIGPKLAERLGQPVIVENRPGASGNIGADVVAKATDGHTLLVSANTLLIAANLYRNTPFDPLKDFQPVSLTAYGTLLLTANPRAQINTLEDFVKQAKAQPGKLAYSSPGIGTPHHMSMEFFKDQAGLDVLHVPYRGSAGALTDLLSGEVPVGFVPVHVAAPMIADGRLKAIAAGADKRHPKAPNVATFEEQGYRGVDVEMWYAVLAPKGVPGAVVERLNREIGDILKAGDVRTTFDRVGLDVAASSPAELAALMQRDNARWAEIIRKNNIKAE